MRVLDAGGNWAPVDIHAHTGFIDGGDPSPSGGVLELIGSPDGALRSSTYMKIYRANPYLWACVQLLARSMARFPLHVFASDPNASTTVRVKPGAQSRSQSLAGALRRPGKGRSQQTLWHSTTVDRLVHGNAVWFPDRDRTGAYLGFDRIPWKHVRMETIVGIDRYWDDRKPKAKRLADDVVHFGAGLDCDELINPSPIESLRATLALYDSIERHLVAYFKNSARHGGHLQVDKATSKGNRDLIRDELQRLYSGPDNAGKIMVTSGEWTPMTEAPRNSDVVDLAKQSREEICAAYGTPPPLIGILDRAIMSNVRELRSHLGRDVCGAHAILFEGDIDAQVIARDPLLSDVGVEFQMAAVLRPDLEARAATWKDQRYLLTLNEMREIENRPRIDHPDADVPWMPLNEAPLGADDSPADDRSKSDDDGTTEEDT